MYVSDGGLVLIPQTCCACQERVTSKPGKLVLVLQAFNLASAAAPALACACSLMSLFRFEETLISTSDTNPYHQRSNTVC
jgi:hypothetical protein